MPIPTIEDVADRRPFAGRGSRLWSEWCFFKVCARHFRSRMILMLLVLMAGAWLFQVCEPEKNHTFLRAMFFTFSLVFGETPEEFPSSRPLQALFFIMPILGLTVIIEGIIDFAMIIRDRRRFERTWCVMHASTYRDHIIVVGLGRLGFHTFKLLRRLGEPVVVIERDPNNQFLEEVRRDGSPFLIGDARRESLLEDANVGKAKSIIVATNDDMANLEAALDARKLSGKIRVVMRMFDQNVANKVRDGFNINLAMSQSAISAPAFASCALAPSTVNSFIVGDQLLAMQRWLVRDGDAMCHKTVGNVMSTHKLMVVEYHEEGEQPTLCPSPDIVLNPGDGIMLQGPIFELNALREKTLVGS